MIGWTAAGCARPGTRLPRCPCSDGGSGGSNSRKASASGSRVRASEREKVLECAQLKLFGSRPGATLRRLGRRAGNAVLDKGALGGRAPPARRPRQQDVPAAGRRCGSVAGGEVRCQSSLETKRREHRACCSAARPRSTCMQCAEAAVKGLTSKGLLLLLLVGLGMLQRVVGAQQHAAAPAALELHRLAAAPPVAPLNVCSSARPRPQGKHLASAAAVHAQC